MKIVPFTVALFCYGFFAAQAKQDNIKQKNIDLDGKLAIIPKDEIKKIIGRSPDEADCLMMRMWFEVQPKLVIHKTKLLR